MGLTDCIAASRLLFPAGWDFSNVSTRHARRRT
jgi:hypothetical protein